MLFSLFEEEKPAARDQGMVPAVRASSGRPNDLRGPRRATVHYKDGVSKRGLLQQVAPLAETIRLEPVTAGSGRAEELRAEALKAIFIILPRGVDYPPKNGQAVRLVMMDGRRLEGYTVDYHPGSRAFTLFPKLDQGNIERVIVYNDAVKNIWFD